MLWGASSRPTSAGSQRGQEEAVMILVRDSEVWVYCTPGACTNGHHLMCGGGCEERAVNPAKCCNVWSSSYLCVCVYRHHQKTSTEAVQVHSVGRHAAGRCQCVAYPCSLVGEGVPHSPLHHCPQSTFLSYITPCPTLKPKQEGVLPRHQSQLLLKPYLTCLRLYGSKPSASGDMSSTCAVESACLVDHTHAQTD